MNKINIFIAASPLQLLNCIEAVHYFKSDNNVLLLLHTNNKVAKLQIEKLTVFVDWISIKYIFLPLTYIKRILFPMDVNNILQSLPKNRVERVFVGDYMSDHINHIVNYFQNKNIYLVDDGLALLGYDQYINNKSYRHRALKALYKLFFYNLSDIKYNFFTIFPIKINHVVKNNYVFFNKLSCEKKIEDVVYFIGQPLIDLSFIEKNKFKRELSKVINSYKNKKFVYILHRQEKDESIKSISVELNFECKRFDNLLELEMLLSEKMPSDFATFYSTAIVILPRFFKKCKYQAFKINDKKINNRAIIKKCYDNFRENNIVIREL